MLNIIHLKFAKLPGTDCSRRFDDAAVAASEKAAAVAAATSLAALEGAEVVYPITSTGFDGKTHNFVAAVWALKLPVSPDYSKYPAVQISGAILAVCSCQRTACSAYRNAAGESLVQAELQLAQATQGYDAAKLECDAAQAAVSEQAGKTQTLTSSGKATPDDLRIMGERSTALLQAWTGEQAKLPALQLAVANARLAIEAIHVEHPVLFAISNQADEALRLTFQEIIERVAAPLRKSHSDAEPVNSGRRRALTWGDR